MDKYTNFINELKNTISTKEQKISDLKSNIKKNQEKISKLKLELEQLNEQEKWIRFYLSAVKNFKEATKREKIKHFIRGLIKIGGFNIAWYGIAGITMVFGNIPNWHLSAIITGCISIITASIEIADYLGDTDELRDAKKYKTETYLITDLNNIHSNERQKIIDIEKMEKENYEFSGLISYEEKMLSNLKFTESRIEERRFIVFEEIASVNEQAVNEKFENDVEVQKELKLGRYKKEQ